MDLNALFRLGFVISNLYPTALYYNLEFQSLPPIAERKGQITMSESQAASALERMYEDTTVRDELIDQDATILLQWGEAQIKRLAQQEMDNGLFEDAYAKLTRIMARINRFVGKRHEADETKLADLLNRFAEVAAEAGYPVPPDKLAMFAKEHAALDDAAAIRAMTALLGMDAVPSQTPAGEAPAAVPSAPASPAAPDAPPVQPQSPASPWQSAVPEQPASPAQPASPEQPTEPDAPKPSALDNIIKWIKSSEGKE